MIILKVETKRYFSGDIESIVVPNLGDSITEGTVTQIYKQIGEKVATDEIVLEIETDKVSVDIRAPKDGYIAQYFVESEQDVEVGGPLYALSPNPVDGVDPSSIKPAATPPKQEEPTSSAPSSPSPSSASSPPPPAPPKPAAQTQSQSTSHSQRIPMIKFKYGLRGI